MLRRVRQPRNETISGQRDMEFLRAADILTCALMPYKVLHDVRACPDAPETRHPGSLRGGYGE
jgi:hypothetical protein